jgi:hypothetical protein
MKATLFSLGLTLCLVASGVDRLSAASLDARAGAEPTGVATCCAYYIMGRWYCLAC